MFQKRFLRIAVFFSHCKLALVYLLLYTLCLFFISLFFFSFITVKLRIKNRQVKQLNPLSIFGYGRLIRQKGFIMGTSQVVFH